MESKVITEMEKEIAGNVEEYLASGEFFSKKAFKNTKNNFHIGYNKACLDLSRKLTAIKARIGISGDQA
jgi:hypothetical protein